MNPYGYSEKWMHSQRDPRWVKFPIGKSDVTLGTDGCLITDLAYLMSRWSGHEITPKDACAWFNITNGFTPDGRFKWDWLKMWSGGGLVYQGTNPLRATYTLQWVQLGQLRHIVTLLRNPANGKTDICFDPWELTNHVQSIYKYSSRYEKVYIRAVIPPKA